MLEDMLVLGKFSISMLVASEEFLGNEHAAVQAEDALANRLGRKSLGWPASMMGNTYPLLANVIPSHQV
jgi:hypothetical protein